MTTHHIIIAGTGRAATSFLILLLDKLGYETRADEMRSDVSQVSAAGYEWNISRHPWPRIVKSPHLCLHLREQVEKHDVVVDYAIVPIRDLGKTAESRIDVQSVGEVRGGVWLDPLISAELEILLDPDKTDLNIGARTKALQMVSNAVALYSLLEVIADNGIPLLLLSFSRLTTDRNYLYRELGKVFSDLPTFEEFSSKYKEANLELNQSRQRNQIIDESLKHS